MKKVLALVMTAVMFLTMISFNAAAAEILTPVSIYAGARTITVEYETSITAENVGDIVLTTSEGTAVEYTTKINDEFLTIIAESEFVRDTQSYYLQIGEVKKLFTVKTLFTPNFVANTANNTVSDLAITASDGSTVDVVDKDTIILSTNQGSFTLDYDEITNYENASIVADVSYIDGGAAGIRGIFGYNVSSKSPTYAYVYNGAKKVNRAFWILDKTANAYYNRRVAVTDGSSLLSFPGYSSAITPLVDMSGESIKRGSYTSGYGTTMVSGQAKVGTNGFPTDYTGYKYHYVIDKMGAVGTLMFEDTFVDVMDSQDYYDEYNAENGTELNAATKGYFVINPVSIASGKYRIIVSNIALITSEMETYKEGDITVPSTELTGTRDSFDIVFSDNVELAVETVKSHIEVSKDDSVSNEKQSVEYDFKISGDTVTITPVGGIEYDTVYYVTVKAGFGYAAFTVKTDIEATYMYESLKGDLEITDVYAGFKDMYITFSGEVEQIKESDFKDKVNIYYNDIEITYNLKLEGEKATLSLNEELETGKIYDLDISAGLGYEKVTVKNDKKNYFILDVVYSTDFKNFQPDASSASLFTAASYDATGKSRSAKNTVRNGKLYTQGYLYSTLHLNKMGIENLERYSMKIEDVQYYGSTDMMLYFNVSSTRTNGGIFKTQGGKPITGFGWHTTATEKQVRDFQSNGIKNNVSSDGTIHVPSENPVDIEVTSMQNVTFASDSNDVDVTVPEGNDKSYTYTLDKLGTLGRLYINNTFVDSYETADVYEKWNKISNKDNQIGADVPTKGYVMLGFTDALENDSTVAFGDISVVTYKEYADGGVKITQDDVTLSGNTANGTIKVRNYFAEDTKKVAVVAAAYGENNKFLGVKKVVDTQLSPGQIADSTYSFSATEEIKEVRTEIIDETSISYTDETEVTTALQTDFDNNIITVKGKVKAKDEDRKLYMLLSKDNQLESWTVTNEADGNFTIVNIPAKASEFEYSFNYEEISDVDPYQMSIYAVVWENGVKPKKLATYNYAQNEDVLAFVEDVKTNKTTFNETTKYAQSLGIDLTFANTEYKQDVLVETIYSERETITGMGSLTSIMSKAKARADLLNNLKKDGTNIAKVDEIITTYAAEAGLILTDYNSLSVSKKGVVCTSFVNADYETLGFMKFAEAFNKAVADAKVTTPPTTGGGGGGGGAGGYTAPATTVVPGKDYSDNSEKEETVSSKSGFTDMADYKWADEAVDYLADKGIISGTGHNKFNPEGIITREQIAKIMVLAMGEFDDAATAEYADVEKSGWAYKYIASAKQSGLMNGFTDVQFAPFAPITREDLAVIIYRAMVKKGEKYETKKSDFSDFGEISDYASDAVEYIAGAGIINGFDDGSFKPKAPATRAQAALLIYKALTGGEGK